MKHYAHKIHGTQWKKEDLSQFTSFHNAQQSPNS